jgi:hypothetical protein
MRENKKTIGRPGCQRGGWPKGEGPLDFGSENSSANIGGAQKIKNKKKRREKNGVGRKVLKHLNIIKTLK